MAWWEGAEETRVLIAPEPSTSGKHMGHFLSLRHPKTGDTTCYLYSNGILQELNWFKQSYGSWFLGDYVCEDGRLYTATPIDPVFVLLPIFDDARMKKGNDPGKFRQLDEIIYIQGYPGYQSLLSIAEKSMSIVCDLQDVGSMKFFRLSDLKVQSWLYYKVQQLKKILPTLNNNYAAQDEKYTLFDAVTIIGEYLKEEPWLNFLCDKFKVNIQEKINAPDVEMLSPLTGNGLNPVQEKNGVEKKATRSTRQAKKAKVETNSKNIKDMFTRASRKGK